MTGNPLRSVLSGGTATAAALLVLIFAVVFVINPSFAEPSSMLAFLKKAAPLVILAAGQYFVIVSGEFDLSVGSLVGAQVVIAAKLLDGEDSRTVPVLLVMVLFGVLVGVVNGVVTTLLRVPSFITTLGMMLVLFGAIRLWTGGAPTGALTEAFRQPGRGGIDAGEIGLVPWAMIVMLVVGLVAVALMRSPWGRTLLAVGDNPVAASFSGVRVALGAHQRVRAVEPARHRRGHPDRRLRRRRPPRSAPDWSSSPSRRWCSAAWRSAAGRATSPRPWVAPWSWRRCSPCSTSSACRRPRDRPCRA